MTMTRNAVGNLMARYKTVLQNCSLLNTFGSLAAATLLAGSVVFGCAANAMAITEYNEPVYENQTDSGVHGVGGVISNVAEEVIVGDNVIFQNNSATNTNGNGAGAILSKAYASSTASAKLTIGDNVSFIGNKSDAVGALYIHLADNNGTSKTTSTATIGNNVLFEGNSTTGGAGAVSIMNQSSKSDKAEASLTIDTGATFRNNSAAMGGGALVATGANAFVSIAQGAVFEDNTDTATTASFWHGGGAILIQRGAEGTLNGATFINNTTNAVGGAIHIADADSTLSFNGTNIFSGNTANGVLNDIHNQGIINVSGNMILDGGISGGGTANFKSDSILTLGENATFTQGTVSTEKGAALVVNSVKGINITEADIAEGSWGYNDGDTSTISTTSAFIKLGDVTYDSGTKKYTVSITQKAATEALPKINAGLGGLIDRAIKDDTSSAGVNFIKEASKKSNGAAVIESAANMSTGANVVGAVGSASTAAVGNTGARTTVAGPKLSTVSESSTWLAMNGDALIIPTLDGGNMAQGFGLWFMPMYNHTSADGFKSGNYSYGYDTNVVGATLGVDYTFASDFRLGLAFNVGEGSSTSTGDFVSTDNDFNYYGLSLYGAKHFANIGLSFDMGYMFSENDMKQKADVGAIGGSVDAGLFTIGTKAEYVLAIDSVNITPYAGLRFNYYTIDAYDTKQNGNTLFSTARSNSTVWEIPVGVTFDTTTKVGAWDMTPSLGLGVKFSMGDLDAEQSVSIAGVAGSSVLSSEVADDVTFQSTLGLGFTKDVCTIGLNYNLDLSENVESHGISVNLRYDF